MPYKLAQARAKNLNVRLTLTEKRLCIVKNVCKPDQNFRYPLHWYVL